MIEWNWNEFAETTTIFLRYQTKLGFWPRILTQDTPSIILVQKQISESGGLFEFNIHLGSGAIFDFYFSSYTSFPIIYIVLDLRGKVEVSCDVILDLGSGRIFEDLVCTFATRHFQFIIWIKTCPQLDLNQHSSNYSTIITFHYVLSELTY
jgi:hypothetical protein